MTSTTRVISPSRLQAGIVPYRATGGQLKVLLITSRSGNRWLVPKGNIEPNLTPIRSAEKEAWEEAGVFGRVHQQLLGTYRYVKNSQQRVVRLYPMLVEEEAHAWPEMNQRQRQWLHFEQAASQVFSDELGETLLRLHSLVIPACAAA